MTLPWFLNPWREVRRLRRDVDFWRKDAGALMVAWNNERGTSLRLKEENAELKRTIADLSKWVPHDPRPVGGDVIRMQNFSEMEDLP